MITSKLVLLNKDRDKPKQSAFKRPTLHILTVRLHILQNTTFWLSLTLVSYNVYMIKSFGNKETEKIWNGVRSKKLPQEIQQIGRRKLRMLNNSQDLQDLRTPPSNRLEKLNGKLQDYNSIRINNQWRIMFIWDNGNAFEVQIIDYH